jgi:thymidylate kinase
MPLTETIRNRELVQPRPASLEGFDPGRSAFFSTLFGALDQQCIRYCALHAHSGLLYGSDFAVHPGDKKKLRAVFLALKQAGYLAVQWLEIESGEHRVVFASPVTGSNPETVTIDLVFRGRNGVRVKQIVQQRRRNGIFWAAAVEKSLERGPQDGIPWRARIIRGARKLRDHFSRKGAFLVFLGPDGVGKTTLLRALSNSLAPAFPEQSIYRWRPTIFARAPRPSSLPHSKPMRSAWGSISYLLFTWLDFTSGYLLALHSVLSRGGLVIFDRYYHDLLIDPKRYRYAGPIGLARFFSRLVPPRDPFFVVLDAEEQTILSRKQQLPLNEIRRQRGAYRAFAGRVPTSVLITTDRAFEHCRAQALEAIFRYLSERLAQRNPAWFEYGKTVVDTRVISARNTAKGHARFSSPALQPESLEEHQEAQAD